MSIEPAPYASPVARESLQPGPTPSRSTEPGTGGPGRVLRAIFGDNGFSFGDLLDIVNPLQHIPLVSTLYRRISGDSIAAGPRLAGGGLFGGVIGLAGAAVNLAVEHSTGSDIGEHVLAMVTGAVGTDGTGPHPPPRPIYVADMEPHERIAALMGWDLPAPAEPVETVATPSPEYAPEYAKNLSEPVEAVAIATARPAPDQPPAPSPAPNVWNMESDERIAALMAWTSQPPAAPDRRPAPSPAPNVWNMESDERIAALLGWDSPAPGGATPSPEYAPEYARNLSEPSDEVAIAATRLAPDQPPAPPTAPKVWNMEPAERISALMAWDSPAPAAPDRRPGAASGDDGPTAAPPAPGSPLAIHRGDASADTPTLSPGQWRALQYALGAYTRGTATQNLPAAHPHRSAR